MFDCEVRAHGFGNKAPTKENQEARAGRLMQSQQQGVDARALRLRRSRLARGRQASSLFGAGESTSLGAGL